MKKLIYVTRAEILAARLIVQRNKARGLTTRPAIAKIASVKYR